MKQQELYYQLLSEVFGNDYVQLIRKDEQTKELNLRNWKLTVIEDINRAKKLMGFTTCVNDEFYKLYDMEPEELGEVQHFYHMEAKMHVERKRDPKVWKQW